MPYSKLTRDTERQFKHFYIYINQFMRQIGISYFSLILESGLMLPNSTLIQDQPNALVHSYNKVTKNRVQTSNTQDALKRPFKLVLFISIR